MLLKVRTLVVAAVLVNRGLGCDESEFENLIVHLSGKYNYAGWHRREAQRKLRKQFPELDKMLQKHYNKTTEEKKVLRWCKEGEWLKQKITKEFGEYLEVEYTPIPIEW